VFLWSTVIFVSHELILTKFSHFYRSKKGGEYRSMRTIWRKSFKSMKLWRRFMKKING